MNFCYYRVSDITEVMIRIYQTVQKIKSSRIQGHIVNHNVSDEVGLRTQLTWPKLRQPC